MSFIGVLRTALVVIVLFWAAQARSATPSIQDLVDQFDPVNYSNLLAHALYTQQGMNRFAVTGAEHDLCRDSIYAEFSKAGLTPYLDWFHFQDTANVARIGCNIVAVKEGVKNPLGEIYIAGGHYDSESNPGADDNATGVAAILEMARIFSQYHFEKTIVFVAFDCEEIDDYYGAHRLGSLHYAQEHQGDNIVGMVSVDMIGHEAGISSNTAWLYGYASSAPVTNALAKALQTYGGLAVSARISSPDLSDHIAFSAKGVPACLLIESSFTRPNNPFYHTSGDFVEQPGNIHWGYAGRMAKGAMGYFAEQLRPVDIVPRGVSMTPISTGALEVLFSGVPGCRYAIEVCTNLMWGEWTVVSTNTAAGTGTFGILEEAPIAPQAFYRARFVSGVARSNIQIVMDNKSATLSGEWKLGTTAAGRYGADYFFAEKPADSYAEYRPNITMGGAYAVYEWHSVGSNRTTDAPIQVHSTDGPQTFHVNQQVAGGQWNLVGTFEFAAGTNNYLRITDGFTTGDVVIADAFKFVYLPDP